jgi:hypothetical protein
VCFKNTRGGERGMRDEGMNDEWYRKHKTLNVSRTV